MENWIWVMFKVVFYIAVIPWMWLGYRLALNGIVKDNVVNARKLVVDVDEMWRDFALIELSGCRISENLREDMEDIRRIADDLRRRSKSQNRPFILWDDMRWFRGILKDVKSELVMAKDVWDASDARSAARP